MLCNELDCSIIKPGGSCYIPDTVPDHASVLYNLYYKQHGADRNACDFGGDAMVVTSNPYVNDNGIGKTWCIANTVFPREDRLQKDMDALCKVVDCTPIRPGGSCYIPNSVVFHASYVFNSYYRAHHSQPSACHFDGDALIVINDPFSTSVDLQVAKLSKSFQIQCDPQVVKLSISSMYSGGVSDVGIKRGVAHTWCIANPLAGNGRLQKDINTLCAVVDCTPIRPGGSCYNPNTVADHASYVFNSYFRARQSAPSTCNFGGDALLVVNNPCKMQLTQLH
uniref:X8 domain-containing protein n=1 Tax=Ananas comosus var. bracteatus TaxID=296719 RepID=A0A6V7QN96_ANACO|nr:unnamed protein product [Ananas comosus var. bracteatus]